MGNYFKRVLKNETPYKETPGSVARHIEVKSQHEKLAKAKEQEMIQRQKNREILGMKDYEVSDYRLQGSLNEAPDYHNIIQGKIPADQIASKQYELEIVNSLNPRHELAVFNIPFDVEKSEIMPLFDKFGIVKDIEFHNSLSNVPCYAIVTFRNQDSLEKCMKATSEIWIRENLLRLRSSEHAELESLKNRTVVISKLPKWATEKDVIKQLKPFGSVLAVDLPKTDARIEQLKENAPNAENERKVKSSYEERLKIADKIFTQLHYDNNPHLNFQVNAEDFNQNLENPSEQTTLAEKILNFDKDLYKEKVANTLTQSPPSDLGVLNNEKRMKILTLCTMVYNENQLLNDSIKDLKVERDNYVNRLNNVMDYPEGGASASVQQQNSFVTAEQIQTLKSYLSYVDKNHDSLPPEIISEVRENKAFQVIRDYYLQRSGEEPSQGKALEEALQTRISNSKEKLYDELAEGYQWLLQSLERREKILTHRLERLLKDYGTEDRILQTDKDFKNELEDIEFRQGAAGKGDFKMEDIISISEQIRNITEWKKPKSLADLEAMDDKQHMGFDGIPNFRHADIQESEVSTRTMELLMKRKIHWKDKDNVDIQNLHKSMPNYWDFEVLRNFYGKIKKAREELDTPFDEMYHREKALIDNVVKAEKELLEAQEAADTAIDNKNRSIEHLFDNNLVGLYEKEDDLRVLLKKQRTSDDSADSLFTERRTLTKNYQDLVMEMVGDKEVDKFLDQQSNVENLGYCFATFSHTDEAKKAMMYADHFRFDTTTRSHKHMFDSFGKSKLYMKNDLTHKDFNIDYLKERTIADANLVDKHEALAQAKKKLKQYEDTFEQHMPKLQKLNKMKRAARDAIDQNVYFDREKFPRSRLENEQLEQKIRDMERRTGTDLSPLLDSETKEQERIQRHKKAFETYKSYSFLKAGLKKTDLEKKLTKDTREDLTQYVFPDADAVASTYINKDYSYSMLREGEENLAPGRKYGFTPQEFVNKYFGKDNLTDQSIEITDRPMYTFNDDMKRRYPYSTLSADPTTQVQEMQDRAIEAYKERYNKSNEANPEWIDDKILSDKDRETTPLEIPDEEILKNNPFTDIPWKKRRDIMRKKIEKSKDPYFEKPLSERELRHFIKMETGDFTDYEVKMMQKTKEREARRDERIKLAAEEKKRKEEEEAKLMESVSEKWKPSHKEEIKNQYSREKVYSEYIDQKKVDALNEGDAGKYNTAELEFLKKYKKAALDTNLDNTDGSAYMPEFYNQDYLKQLSMKRNYLKGKQKHKEAIEKFQNQEFEDKEHHEFANYKYEALYGKPREDVQKLLDKNKTEQRKLNEKFFYRQEFAKDDPELRKSLEVEESVNAKWFRKSTPNEKNLRKVMRENKDSILWSDRDLKTDFKDNLSKGDLVKGLLDRKQQLKEGMHNKGLDEIGQGEDDIYKTYQQHQSQAQGISKENEIDEREKKFLEAAQKEYEATSPTSQKTFQDYEDYKRRVQEMDDPEGSLNSETEVPEDLGTREWYSKIWSGKITNKEFQEYMFEEVDAKDRFGSDSVKYVQKSNPGYGPRDFCSHDDKNRLSSEMIEAERRQAVQYGLCTEADSHEYIKNFVEELKEKLAILNRPSNRRFRDEYLEMAKAATAGEQVREYYFDPKQGVTLSQHIESVQKVFPDAKIESYVDDDGFTVVKRTQEKKYKYNLNDLLNYAPSEVERKYHQGVKQMIDQNNISINNEEDLVNFLEDPRYKNSDIYTELMNIQEKYGDLVDDFDTFKSEIREQIEIKKLRYKYFNKLGKEDFVKPQMAEEVIMDRLQKSYDQSVLNYEASLQESDRHQDYLNSVKGNSKAYEEAIINPDINVMSKERYRDLRNKIKETKEAKARLLKQGFPTLENYVYL